MRHVAFRSQLTRCVCVCVSSAAAAMPVLRQPPYRHQLAGPPRRPPAGRLAYEPPARFRAAARRRACTCAGRRVAAKRCPSPTVRRPARRGVRQRYSRERESPQPRVLSTQIRLVLTCASLVLLGLWLRHQLRSQVLPRCRSPGAEAGARSRGFESRLMHSPCLNAYCRDHGASWVDAATGERPNRRTKPKVLLPRPPAFTARRT